MSYNQYFPHSSMDMGSFSGIIFGIILEEGPICPLLWAPQRILISLTVTHIIPEP